MRRRLSDDIFALIFALIGGVRIVKVGEEYDAWDVRARRRLR